jgi:hypothetical protein
MTTMTTQGSGARSVASVKMGSPSLVFGRCLFSSSWGPSARPIPAAPERGVPGDGPRPREERPERERRSEWRRRQASRTASAFLGVGGDIHTLMSSPGPRPRGGMMPGNDTWRGRKTPSGQQKTRPNDRPFTRDGSPLVRSQEVNSS